MPGTWGQKVQWGKHSQVTELLSSRISESDWGSWATVSIEDEDVVTHASLGSETAAATHIGLRKVLRPPLRLPEPHGV
jgi:hypothetical protein